MKRMTAITVRPGAATSADLLTAPWLSAATTPPPAAATTRRNVPNSSEKSRRHSWLELPNAATRCAGSLSTVAHAVVFTLVVVGTTVYERVLATAAPWGLCHLSPGPRSASAGLGPHPPGLYAMARRCRLRMGSTTVHAASTAASLVKRVPSPAIASPRRRSYGDSAPRCSSSKENSRWAPENSSPARFKRAAIAIAGPGWRRNRR